MTHILETLGMWPDLELKKIVTDFCCLFDWSKFLDGSPQLSQCLDDFQQLKEEIGERKFNNFYEVGSWSGGSAWVYSHLFLNPGAKIVLIDYFPLESLMYLKDVIDILRKEGFIVEFRRESSSAIDIEKDAIELLHIDGDHSYESVKNDFYRFEKKVIPGGIILLHDTIGQEGPAKLVKEISGEYKCKTFCGNLQVSGGVGFGEQKESGVAGLTMVYK